MSFLSDLAKGLANGLMRAVGGLVNSLSEDVDRSSAAGYVGPAKMMTCGVCGMVVPRDAQKCPYCKEQPNCYRS